MWAVIAAVLILVWLVSFIVLHVTSFFIHILLIIGLIALVLHFVRRNRA